MPPKRKQQQIDGGTIVNYYEKMPEEFLNKVDNPNKHLHNLDLPFRMLIVAPSGSGKTNFVIHLLNLFCQGRGSFSQILILTKHAQEPLYDWLKTKNESIIIKEGLAGNLPPLDDKTDKDLQKLVILDDLVLEAKQTNVESYFVRCRKFGWSIIYISQSYFRISKTIRLNANYVALLKIGSKRDLNLILSESCIGVTKEQLMHMYEYATAKKFDVLLIHLEANPSERFYKNFTIRLNPEAFYEEVMGEH
jgi:hypothetical protein